MGNNIDIPASGGGSGAVVAVKSVTMYGTQTTTAVNGSFVDVTDGTTALSLTYTPTSASNLILVRVVLNAASDGSNGFFMRLMRDATPLVGTTAGSRTSVTNGFLGNSNQDGTTTSAGEVIDSPATTSPVTYKVQFSCQSAVSGVAYINRSRADGSIAYDSRGVSTLTIMEVTP